MNVSPNEGGDVIVNGKTQTTASAKYSCSIGKDVSLEAVPAEGYKLDRWTGVSGTGNSVSVTVDGSKTVTASFVLAVQERSARQAKDMLDAQRDLIVLDVSSVGNFDSGHILCARNHPWNGNFGGGIAELNPYKNRDILLYDQNDSRSEAAADNLISQGFTSLYLINGGLNAWKSQGYEVIPTSCNCEDCSLPPMAFAGADQQVGENETVQLNASGSRDPDGGNLTYHWEQTDGKQVVDLMNPNTARPEFISPYVKEGGDTLIFRVTVKIIKIIRTWIVSGSMWIGLMIRQLQRRGLI